MNALFGPRVPAKIKSTNLLRTNVYAGLAEALVRRIERGEFVDVIHI